MGNVIVLESLSSVKSLSNLYTDNRLGSSGALFHNFARQESLERR